MFVVASFSIVSGLKVSMEVLSDNFQTEYYLVTFPGTDGMDFFSVPEVILDEDRAACGIVVPSVVSTTGGAVNVFSISDPDKLLPETIVTDGTEVLAGTSVSLTGSFSLTSEDSIEVTVAGRYSSTLFPSDWLFASEYVTRSLSSCGESEYNFVLTGDMTEAHISSLRDEGYSVQSMIGVLDFLESSIDEIERDTYWILAPSSFVIAVLAYSFMGSEISDRRHEIGIVKAIGAGRKQILGMLLGEAAIISVWGSLLGLALGIVLAYGVSTAASVVFTSVFVVDIQESILVLSVLVTISSAVVGAILPAVRMTTTRPVEDLREVMP